ncbi:sigma-54-dependent transcriptional regulator [Pseudomonas sp. BIGb0450]|uniref:sigma-54 interaction domain-containing protein n=1 Tax=unclassified Pseudomonas TaxID=196821 RepID=UPI0021693596|nr:MULTISPECIES: sigma 54-interacting transcriptional regulator [unclassified Pseudomonas]MCS3420930.1 sigma-54-dependent transcriptional regulator [Pseudomonas sp. BIGb0558]MCS3439455.1 sigma-54-dependent transcriptional regulator [Pseudomonas sp. BIGb0450]
MKNELFARLPNPLDYAGALLGWFIRLGAHSNESTLAEDFAAGAAQLSACELSQLYLFDQATGRLDLAAQHLPGVLPPGDVANPGTDFKHEQLLQYVLGQNRVLNLTELVSSVYDTAFLPALELPWQSLLCVPLPGPRQQVSGVLLCASQRGTELAGYGASLGQLGSFALNQLAMLRRMRRVPGALKVVRSTPGASAYGLIGNSTAMDETCRLIGKVVHSPYTVLLRGETGTGKEVVARAIHAAGSRSSKAFVVQNCAAFPEGLLESELFGYRKGAFTGADRDYVGLFDTAHGGTLLLDEIGDMPLPLQAKLLRVLQEGEIRPLGANTAHKVDVRILAATHRDLTSMVADGSFREDLYYRLAQFPIELPALRQRDGDVLQLARHFADKACSMLGRASLGWSSAALDQLSSHSFPGNVRELKCMVERAVLLCDDDVILPAHLSLSSGLTAPAVDATLRQRMERVERVVLIDCLRKNRGNRTRTARELGLARRTLLYRLARLDIPFGDAKGEC